MHNSLEKFDRSNVGRVLLPRASSFCCSSFSAFSNPTLLARRWPYDPQLLDEIWTSILLCECEGWVKMQWET